MLSCRGIREQQARLAKRLTRIVREADDDGGKAAGCLERAVAGADLPRASHFTDAAGCVITTDHRTAHWSVTGRDLRMIAPDD